MAHLSLPLALVPIFSLLLAVCKNTSIHSAGLSFLMGGTLFVYAAERFPTPFFKDKNPTREALLMRYRPALLLAALSGLSLAIIALFYMPLTWRLAPPLLLTTLYPLSKRLRGLKNLLVPSVWWMALSWIALQEPTRQLESCDLLFFLLIFASTLQCDLKELGTKAPPPFDTTLTHPGDRCTSSQTRRPHANETRAKRGFGTVFSLRESSLLDGMSFRSAHALVRLFLLICLALALWGDQPWAWWAAALILLFLPAKPLSQEILGPTLVDAALLLPGLLWWATN
jgi:hypothetical protein